MNNLELIGGALAYASTVYSLSLVSWAVVRQALPAGSRVSLRLAAVLVGQFVGCAILVQTLGLGGRLHAGPYLAVALAAGAVVSWYWREERLHHSLWRLLRDAVHLWLDRTPLGLGYLSALGFLFLAYRLISYVNGIDSLTIHGPLIVEWVQLGRIELTSPWNYPQCWEYQYAPNFLLLRSDVLVVVPKLLQIAALLLVVHEVASRLRVPGKIACLVSLLSVFNPAVWGGTLKNDPAVATGVLLSLLALERAARGRHGAVLLSQLGTFMILGTKASGFVYVGLFFGAFAAVWLIRWWRNGRSWWEPVLLLAGTCALQVSAAAVQIYNFIHRGNPTYPIKLQVAGRVVFDGPSDLSGTSILEAACEIGTWIQLLRGSTLQVGLDLPFLGMILLSGTLFSTVLLARGLSRGRRPNRHLATLWGFAVSTCLLWVLYSATPWSRGSGTDPIQHIRHGSSLRYALGPICLSYALAAAYLVRWFGRQKVFTFLSSTFLVLVLTKWMVSRVWHAPILPTLWRLLVLFAAFCAAVWTIKSIWRAAGRLPRPVRNTARVLVAAGLGALALVSYIDRIENRRPSKWQPSRRELWEGVRNEVPSGSVIGTNRHEVLFGYLLFGARLENEIRYVRAPSQEKHTPEPGDPDYYYIFFGKRTVGTKDKTLAALRDQGWRPFLSSADKRSVLLRRDGLSHR